MEWLNKVHLALTPASYASRRFVKIYAMEPLISKETLSKAAGIDKWPVPGLDRLLMQLMKLDHFNNEFARIRHLEGEAFIDGVLEMLGIQVDVDEAELARIPHSGAFIAVANHPYGGIEGLILLKMMCAIRPEGKVVANFLLNHIENLRDYFIAVNPFHDAAQPVNLVGVRKLLRSLREGIPVAVFPAGEVSAYQPGLQRIADKRWHPVLGKVLLKAAVPVVPIYFFGQNSLLFNLLGLIHPTLRTARLPAELFNKKGRSVRVRIGAALSPADILPFAERPKALLDFVRARTYALGMDTPRQRWNWLARGASMQQPDQELIANEIGEAELCSDIGELMDGRLLSAGDFDVFLADAQRIPNILLEIGRLREMTFRAVGEGTNRSRDLDVFDIHYRHLFVWDRANRRIAGAYRIGFGEEILYSHGKRGFYLSQLFRLDKGMLPFLHESLELGRSWVRLEYQQSTMPLYLLWKGVACCLDRHPQYRYLLGPVSISGSFSRFSRSVIVEFIRRNCFDKQLAAMVKPRKRFKPSLMKMDLDALLDKPTSMAALERLIMDIEKPNLRFPVLLRHYLKLDAKIIAFNEDPKFNHCLDGFLVFDRRKLTSAVESRFFGK